MRVLVTGGHGFVGSHLVRALLARGDRVRCLVRRNGVPESLAATDVEIAPGDLRDPAAVARAVEGVEEVFHLAGLTRSLTRRQMMETNREGTRRLLDACARARLPGRFLFCSSLSVTGPSKSPEPYDETAAPSPVSWYGESKVEAERLVLESSDRLAVTIVRPPVVYGPRDPYMLPIFRAACGPVLPLLAGSPLSLSLVYAPDLADAMVTAARSPATVGRTYFVADPSPVATEVVMDEIARAVGGRPWRLNLPRPTLVVLAAAGEIVAQVTGVAPLLSRQRLHDLTGTHWICSPRALERDVGWRAPTSLPDGIARTAAWYREHGWLRRDRRRVAPTARG